MLGSRGLRAMSEAAAMWWFKELKVVKVVAKLSAVAAATPRGLASASK